MVQGSTLFQILHFYRNKKSAGVSIGFWWVVYFGLMSYLVYSISIADWVYITSNTIGIVLSSISIVMYYHYRKAEENGNGNSRVGFTNLSDTPGLGGVKQPAKAGNSPSRPRAVLSQVPMCRGGSADNRGGLSPDLWEMQKKEMLRGLTAKQYYISVCACGKHATNFQGTWKYLSTGIALEMIGAGCKIRRFECYHCKQDALQARRKRGEQCEKR